MNARLLYAAATVALLALSACAQTQPAASPESSAAGASGPAYIPPAPSDNPAGSTDSPPASMAVPSAPPDDLYLRADTNKDGRVSPEEWDAARHSAGSAGAPGSR